MSQVIRIPSDIYSRLEQHASGFDSPANVIEKLLNHFEGVNVTIPPTPKTAALLKKRLFSNKEIQQKLSQVAKSLPEHELEKLCDKRRSKEIFNIDFPLFIKVPANASSALKANAVKDDQGMNRWTWKFEFSRNNFLYAITTQWYERHDARVKEWLNTYAQ